MVDFRSLFGANGLVEQLMLWGLLNQVIEASTEPALTALREDVAAKNPVVVLDPATLATAAVRGMATIAEARADAARSGIDAARFATLVDLATVRIPPADLATAQLRSYMTAAEAEAQAAPQGFTAAQFQTLVNLAGDGIAPTDAVRALLRGIIGESGSGAGSTSYTQAIAESRLHDKWGPVLKQLAEALLTPGDVADAVVRNFITHAQGQAVAAKQGFTAGDFTTLVQLAGDAPAPGQLAEALRRKLIPESGAGADSVSFAQGIAEGRLADKWTPVIKGLSKLWPSPTAALDAQVKGQLTEAEANALYEQLGGDLQFKTWLFDSIGEGPTPLQAAALAARGIIPWSGTGAASTSYDQAVRESRYRDKWSSAYRALSEHIPPPSTIVQLLAHGIIDKATATKQLLQNDMSAEQAAAYVAEAQYTEVSQYRGLAQGEVVDMYFGRLIDRAQASSILAGLHMAPDAIGLVLGYADMRYAVSAMTRTVTRLGSLFAARKIGVDVARAALIKLGIPVSTVTQILSEWELQASVNVKTLSESQIVSAWYYQAVTSDEAIHLLTALGYTPYDAWVVLSVKSKGPLPNKPPSDAAAAQPPVSPGTT